MRKIYFIVPAIIVAITVILSLLWFKNNWHKGTTASINKIFSTSNLEVSFPRILSGQTINPKKQEKFYAPILLYHHIAKVWPQNSYYVSPEIFDEQLKWLKDNDYQVISLDQLYRAATGQGYLPSKPVVISFDDSVLDQYTNGLPILKKYGFTATFFIKLNNIGKGGVTWEMIKELRDAGMTIGSHSVNHDNMAIMDAQTLTYELQQSKRIIEQNLGQKIDFFSYPGGAYSLQTINMAKAVGYKGAVTTKHKVYQEINETDDLYILPRVHIDDEMPTFIDWVKGKNLK